MNENLASVGGLSAKADTSRLNLHIGIQQIDNGFVLNWYDNAGPHNVFCASLDDIRSKFDEVFAK